jgi:hypothetical protein
VYKTPCRLYLTADGRVVRDGDLDAAILLAPAGKIITDDVVRRHKIDTGVVETKAIAGIETTSPAAPPASKGKRTTKP